MKYFLKRRLFFLGVLLAVLLSILFSACNLNNTPPQTIKWRMATSWTKDNLIYTEGAVAVCQKVAKLSSGRLLIEAYPTDELTSTFGVFDMVSQGKVECGHSWPGYWRDKEPSFVLFSSVPNMMTVQEWGVWLYGPSQGIELWRELYGKYNVVPFPGALDGPEFGFFTNRPLRSVDDFKGMRLRTPGIGADVLRELGATPVILPQEEIKEALKKGEIDGFEFGTPALDWNLGFDSSIAPYVTLPAWHQPSCMYDTLVNQDAWNKLPDDLKAIFESACKEVGMVDFVARIEGANPDYLQKYEKSGMQIFVLDEQSMKRITEITDRLCDNLAANDAFFARVLKSQRDFRTNYRTWEKWGDYQIYPSK
jgi:TRAP-type mannitol/chloroaromatic compound transport system substrate-binding protein